MGAIGLDRTRLLSLGAIALTALTLGLFYVPSAAATVFGFRVGEVLLPGGVSLTHGWAAVAFLAVFAGLTAYYRPLKEHRLAAAVIAVAAGILVISDYAEFLGTFLPWVWAGSALSIVVGAWLGFLVVEALR